MKVGIIFINQITFCPYIYKYIDILESNDVNYDIIIWDRTGARRTQDINCKYIYNCKSKESKSKIFKLFDFIRYGNFVKKILRKNKYDKLIILSTLTGIMLYTTLIKQYKNNYIFDFRDLSYENYSFFKKKEEKLIKNSYFTCISSKGFLEYLPKKYNYLIAHNFRYLDLKNFLKNSYVKNKYLPINVSFIGGIRETFFMKRLFDIFGNDERFILNINGDGDNLEELRLYAKSYKNVMLTGRYNNDEKSIFNLKADIICYNYPSSFINDHALANKYYDALIYKRPMLGNIETYSGNLIEKKKLGISLALEDKQYTDKLYNYYSQLDEKSFLESCTNELKKVLHEDEIYLQRINDFVESKTKKAN